MSRIYRIVRSETKIGDYSSVQLGCGHSLILSPTQNKRRRRNVSNTLLCPVCSQLASFLPRNCFYSGSNKITMTSPSYAALLWQHNNHKIKELR